jgi:hypothetical protein
MPFETAKFNYRSDGWLSRNICVCFAHAVVKRDHLVVGNAPELFGSHVSLGGLHWCARPWNPI